MTTTVLGFPVAFLTTALLLATPAQQVGAQSVSARAVYDLDVDALMVLSMEAVGTPDLPTELQSTGSGLNRRARRALNLEVAGWLLAGFSAPAFPLAYGLDVSCREEFVVGPAITFGIGVSTGMIGTIMRARRLRGVPRMRFGERQQLFRSPVGRGVGFAALALGALMSAVMNTTLRQIVACRD